MVRHCGRGSGVFHRYRPRFSAWCCLSTIAPLWLWLAVPVQSARDPRAHVLLLYSEQHGSDTDIVLDHALGALREAEHGAALDLSTEPVDETRLADSGAAALSDALQHKYRNVPIDVVVGLGSTALGFLDTYRRTLFPDVPVVICGITDDLSRWSWQEDVTGVAGDIDIAGTVELMRRLQPGLRRVLVVSGAGAADRDLEIRARAALADTRVDLEIRHLTAFRLDDLLTTVGQLSPESAVLFLSMLEDARGRRLASNAVLRSVADASSVPVYGIAASQIGSGVVGGKLFTPDILSGNVADVVSRVLQGTPLAELPLRQVDAAVPTVDGQALRRWAIDTANLPVSVRVVNQPLSMWGRGRWPIILIAAVCLLESVILAALFLRQRERRRDAREIRAQRRELTHLSRVATLGELTGALAHELNQPLTAILSNAQAAQRYLGTRPIDVPELRAALADIVDADKRAADVIGRVRTLLKKEDAVLSLLRVDEVVRETVDLAHSELVTRRVSPAVRSADDGLVVLGDRVQLQQVMLNLLLNACDAMSANALNDRRLTIVTARESDDSVRIEVVDRGEGIAVADIDRIFEPFVSSKRQGLGLGLAICRSIITAHGGRLWASNNPERGATFHVRLPLTRAEGQAMRPPAEPASSPRARA